VYVENGMIFDDQPNLY